MPALLTSTYTAPQPGHDLLHRGFHGRGIGDVHFLENAARGCASPSFTSHEATRQPSCAKRRAVASPMPAAAPVTITTYL